MKAASDLPFRDQCPMHSWLSTPDCRMNVACKPLPRVLASAPMAPQPTPRWWESPDPREGSRLYPQFCGGIGADTGPSWGERLLPFGTPWTPKGLVASQWLWLWSKGMENPGATSAHAFSFHTASTFSVSQQHSLLGSFDKILWHLHRWLGVRTFEEIQDPRMRS